VSKQSAQDCYVVGITVVNYSKRHASLDNWSTAAMSVELKTFVRIFKVFIAVWMPFVRHLINFDRPMI